MAEVIGIINGIIALVETSIKIYDSARKDIKLSKNFKAVRYRLPIILDTLAVCKSSLEPRKASIPEDVCEALEKTLEGCEAKASNLRGIFEKIIPGESDTWRNRYSKVLSRYGKGNKVEELMLGLAEEVQLIVNHDAVSSASQKQNFELDDIIREMKSVISSGKDEDKVTMNFNTGGGAQANYINPGRGQQINNSGSVGTLNINSVFQKQKEDFSFCGPVGLQIGQAPYIAPGLFVGRGSELEQIRELLQPALGAHKQQRLVLGGKGGIGKTQLAIAYAESRSESYTSVFWLNASSEAALQKSFLSIARLIFDIQDPLLLENKDVIVRVQRWLSDPLNTGWLLIFDNYDDPNLFDINVYYPPASQGSILVTTRCQDQIEGTIMHVKPLQNTRDGLTILQTRSERDNVQSDVYAKRLAERLAGLPLALATAGTYLKHSTFSFERYLCEYEKRWDIGPTQLQEYRERTLYTTWDLSYSRLKAHDADAAELLRLLAYFDNQNLWYELFHDGITEAWPTWLHKLRSCFGEKKPRFKRFHSRIIEGSPKWLSQLLKDDVSFQRVMRTLTEYYFLEVHPASTSWSMHHCVHDWTLATLNEEIDLSYYWYAFDCIDASISGVDMESFGRIAFSRSAGHATRLVQRRFLESNIISNGTFYQLHKTIRVAKLLQDQIHLVAAEQMYTRALGRYEKALGPEHTSTLLAVHDLGNLYSQQGKLEQAEQMCTRALVGYEKVLGPEHTSTLLAAHNLGNLYSQQGKLEEAEQIFTRALGGHEKALRPDHISTLNSVSSLGNVYTNQGMLEQAEQMYTRALSGYEKALGPEHTLTLDALNNLGTLYTNQSKLEQAEQIYTRALAGYEKALGLEHTSTLRTIYNLGNLYSQQGKPEQAEQMYTRALAGYEKALGPEHTLTLDAFHSFGLLYSHQNKLEHSERMYTRALSGYEKALGPEHTSTLLAVNNLGTLYSYQGKLEQAEQMYTRAFSGYEKALGLGHTSTLRTVYNLGNLYSQQGKLEQAEQMFVLAR